MIRLTQSDAYYPPTCMNCYINRSKPPSHINIFFRCDIMIDISIYTNKRLLKCKYYHLMKSSEL